MPVKGSCTGEKRKLPAKGPLVTPRWRASNAQKKVVGLSRKALETLQTFVSKCEGLLELCKTRDFSALIPLDPITLESLEVPVVDENRHSFELPSLLHRLERKKIPPVTNTAYKNPDLHPQNFSLCEIIEKFAQLDEENKQKAAALEEEVKRFNGALKNLTKEMVQVEQHVATPTE